MSNVFSDNRVYLYLLPLLSALICFQSESMSEGFRPITSEIRKSAEYVNANKVRCFRFLVVSIINITSSFDRTMGSIMSILGRFSLIESQSLPRTSF